MLRRRKRTYAADEAEKVIKLVSVFRVTGLHVSCDVCNELKTVGFPYLTSVLEVIVEWKCDLSFICFLPCGLSCRYAAAVAGIAGSNSVDVIVRLLFLLCVVQVMGSATSWSLVEGSPPMCVSNCVWSRSLNNEVAWAGVELLSHRKFAFLVPILWHFKCTLIINMLVVIVTKSIK
jgi:hypothetical protein